MPAPTASKAPANATSRSDRATVLHLDEEDLIVGIKDSSGDDANFRGLVMETRRIAGFAAFTGSELMIDSMMLISARGSVPGMGNVDPAGYVRLYDAARKFGHGCGGQYGSRPHAPRSERQN